jgi:hypothetical protein
LVHHARDLEQNTQSPALIRIAFGRAGGIREVERQWRLTFIVLPGAPEVLSERGIECCPF